MTKKIKSYRWEPLIIYTLFITLTEAKDHNEDAVDDELPDGCPHIDLLVHIDGRHLAGVPHAPDEVCELVPASLLRLPALLDQGELVIAHLMFIQDILTSEKMTWRVTWLRGELGPVSDSVQAVALAGLLLAMLAARDLLDRPLGGLTPDTTNQ